MFKAKIDWGAVWRVIVQVVKAVTGPRLQLWLIAFGAPVVTALVWVWVGQATSFRWPADLRAEQLLTLRHAIYLAFGLLFLNFLAIAAGLITGVKLTGPGGFSADIDTAGTPGTTQAKFEGTATLTPAEESPDAPEADR